MHIKYMDTMCNKKLMSPYRDCIHHLLCLAFADVMTLGHVTCCCHVTGVCAAVVDIGATWMSDLKEGVCLDAFWLNREHCCWAANDTTFDSEGCTQVTGIVVPVFSFLT